MSGYQIAIICGHVGGDPEFRSTQQGSRSCSFSIATSKSGKKQSGEKWEKTQWHKIVVWNQHLIDKVIEPYVKKGSLILLEGEIETRKYQAREGHDVYTTEIVLGAFDGKVTLLGGRDGASHNTGETLSSGRGGGASRGSARAPAAQPEQLVDRSTFDLDDEIPF